MPRILRGSFVIHTLSLVLGFEAAAQAGVVYVPVLDAAAPANAPRSTEVVLATSAASDQPVVGTLLAADTDGTLRASAPPPGTVPAGRTIVLRSPTPPPPVGMFEVDAPATVAVAARVRPAAGAAAGTPVASPVVSSENLIAANGEALLLGLERGGAVSTDVTLINLSGEPAHCQIAVFRADGSQVAGTATISLLPLSLRHYRDALGILGEASASEARLSVSCDQAFYAFATRVDTASASLAFLLPAATGASTLVRPQPPAPPPPNAAIVFRVDGLVHEPVPGAEVRILPIPVPRQLALQSLTVDLDVVPGRWNTRKNPGVHGILWLNRGRFRSSTIANLSAVYADSPSLRMNQNVDLPAGSNRSASAAYKFVQGATYHLRYTYDAAANQVTLVLSLNGDTLRTLRMEGTAAGNVLTVPSSGLLAQFGNYGTEPGPEVASYGWRYLNLQVSMLPYS